MREAGLSYKAIAHRVGRNVATVFILVMAQLLYKVLSKNAISGCCIFHDR
jgi:hypothetical protein